MQMPKPLFVHFHKSDSPGSSENKLSSLELSYFAGLKQILEAIHALIRFLTTLCHNQHDIRHQ